METEYLYNFSDVMHILGRRNRFNWRAHKDIPPPKYSYASKRPLWTRAQMEEIVQGAGSDTKVLDYLERIYCL